MDQNIRERFTPAILAAAHERYDVAEGAIRLLDGFESHILEFERGGESFILRLSHSSRRSPEMIHGEVDWINHLARGGAGVARALPSPAGELIEPIDDRAGGQFLATAFVKAQGVMPWERGWSPELYEAYGRLIGRTHALTKDYAPPRPEWRRPEWDDPVFDYVALYMPAKETVALERYREAHAHVRSLPRGRDNYGLTHQDAHGANMHLDDAGRLTLFDFDDCGYHYFANDIAMCLFYLTVGNWNSAERGREFLTHFMKGYREENTPAEWWLAELPAFLKLREIELYAQLHREFDIEHGGVAAIDDEWCRMYMEGRKERIDAGAAWLELAWGEL
jgi:Ser/Thr protein kinase RdoA (MazF antagonist)